MKSHIADHSIVKFQYHCKAILRKPQIRKVRNWKNLTHDNIMNLLESNEKIQSAFQEEDPDKIASIIVEELNDVVETLAPAKTVQNKKENYPYITREVKDLKKEAEYFLEDAIKNKDRNQWKEYTKRRNIVTK